MSLELLLRAKLISNEADHALKDADTQFAQYEKAKDKMAESESLMRLSINRLCEGANV